MRKNPYMNEDQLLELNNWLLGPEACDFTETTWICHGDLSFTRLWLFTKKVADIEACLEWFHDGGGHCDCEVLWNVLDENRWPETDDDPPERWRGLEELLSKLSRAGYE